MKWFKHVAASKSDPDIMESELRFGTAGPYVFWRTLELLSYEDAVDKPLSIHYRVFMQYFPSIRTWPRLEKILEFFTQRAGQRNGGEIESSVKRAGSEQRFTVERAGDILTVHCQKLSTISDDYTRKLRTKSTKSPDKHRTKSHPEVEVDKDPPIVPPKDSVEEIAERASKGYVDLIFTAWQESKDTMTHMALGPGIKKNIELWRGQYSPEDLIGAIRNYGKVLVSRDHWWTYKFTCEDFFRKGSVQKPAPFKKFLDEAQPLENYRQQANISQQSTQLHLTTPEEDGLERR